jgi:outer membrane protein assembly factor BamB
MSTLCARLTSLIWLFVACFTPRAEAQAADGHRFLIQGNGRLAIVAADGKVEWEMPWGAIHDVHLAADGNILVQKGASAVAAVDRATKQVIWSFDAARRPENAGKKVEVHAFQPLPDGGLMIAESGPGRIIEIDRDGKVQKEIKLEIEHPHPHTDTRLARKLENGNYLVCHEADGVVREYDPTGRVVWKFAVPLFGKEPRGGHGPEAFGNKVFSAVRLPSGNTLLGIGNGHGVLEVTPAGEIVWQIHQNDLPNITLAWVTTLEVLPNGNYVIGNCHAGPDHPVLIELEPKAKRVVWTYAGHHEFGNNVSNTLLLDTDGKTLR